MTASFSSLAHRTRATRLAYAVSAPTSLRWLSLALLCGACASAPAKSPEPAAPVPAPVPAAPAVSSVTALPSAAETASPAPSAPADAPAATAPDSGGPTRSQKPIDIITARDAAFLIDYANSEPKAAAQARCEKEAKSEPVKLGACLEKARDQFLPDVLRFRRDSETQVSLLVYKRNGSTLRELSVTPVTFDNETGDDVRVKFSARTKGARPIWRGKQEATLHVPTDYGLEVDDADLGHLRYDAKIGLVTD